MNELTFEIVGVEPDRYAASPTLNFKLRIGAPEDTPVHVLALRAQIRIEPQRRRYDKVEEERLLAVFGETPNWAQSLRPFLWTHASAIISGFVGETEVDLPVACTYDFDITSTKYMHALEDGEIPLIFLFSGTVFTKKEDEAGVSVTPVPWHKESSLRLPVKVWREMMDLYFPNGGWLRIDRQTIDALERFKTEQGLPTWEQAIETLLKEAGA